MRVPHLDFQIFVEAANNGAHLCLENVLEGWRHTRPASCLSQM